MIEFTTGNILNSDVDCLVNTVNCEGYMGKGIAYQFKQAFPDNYKAYVEACRKGQMRIGSVFIYSEDGKTIVNFPTKDKWRNNSKIEYIQEGLENLVDKLTLVKPASVAIPPLGCGNGGLQWHDVKGLIEEYLSPVPDIKFIVYEPSNYYKADIKTAPKLNLSHLVLMQLKFNLVKFDKIRLQKCAYFFNIFSGQTYFSFERAKYGPYAHSIDILSKQIKEYQSFYNIDTSKAYELAHKELVSESIANKLEQYRIFIIKSSSIVNNVKSQKDLEVLASVSRVIEEHKEIDEIGINNEIKHWSERKKEMMSGKEIKNALNELLNYNIIQQTVMNTYRLYSNS